MSEKSGKVGKIYCANCINCKIVKAYTDDGAAVKKVRCAAGHWKKRKGAEKLYQYDTVTRRTIDTCLDYGEMGDTRAFIKELKRNLPSSKSPAGDDVYSD